MFCTYTQVQAKMAVMEKREDELRKRSKMLEAAAAADFIERVNEAEAQIKRVVKELQQSGGTFKDVDSARKQVPQTLFFWTPFFISLKKKA
jgi:hypothetical protein